MIPRGVRGLTETLNWAGLALVLGMAGCQGTPGSGSDHESAGDPGRVLAEIDGTKITEADVDARLAELPTLARPEFSSPIGKERLLRQMIEEEVLYRAAIQDGLDQDADVVRALDRTRRQLLTQAYLDQIQEAALVITDDEAREFYESHLDEYQVERTLRVRILNNSDENTVRRAREMVVEERIPFVAVCSKFNEKPLLVKAGGLLPNWVRKGRAVAWLGNSQEFHDAAFNIELGIVSDVFESVHGFNVLLVEEERKARQRTFDEARADVRGRIARDRSSQGLPQLMTELKERYHVEIVAAPQKSAEQMFAEAQAAPTASRKVELFRDLVERYPKDDHVLEALFMIGFTLSEELSDEEGAKVALQRVIDEFPDSELARSARWMLSTGGAQTPEFEGDESASSTQE